MDDLLSEFLTETAESLDTVNLELVKLEQDPNNKGVLSNIFRLVHTIKGTCGFLGLPRLEGVAHAGENILGKFRDGEIEVTPDAVSLILESLDRIKMILGELEANETEPEGDDSDLIARLNAMAAGGGAPAPKAAAAPPPTPKEDAPLVVQTLERELRPGEVSLDELERAFRETAGPEEETGGTPEAAPAPTSVPAVVAAAEPAEEAEPAPKPAQPSPAAASSQAAAANANGGGGQAAESAVANQSIRVSVELLENLMTLVSELVLTRNQLMQMVRRMDDTEFKVPLQRLSHVTTELQEGVMKTRMQPIGNAWQKLPRIVRDLSLELGKKINLQMVGAETELDRQVLELIKDPLTHMVRNSADHGLETTEERRRIGKPETGRITLTAYHEGGHIIIDISDDGRGLNLDKIKQKALSQGIVTDADLANMSEAQIMKFIMAPGFSTAEKVTNVSGRGVGMDVVRSNIEKIGGSIDMSSTWGKGSSFTIKIPLTLAIVSALIVEVKAQRFAIPQLAVVELVRASKDSEHRIEWINRTPVLRLRNRLLPLVNLSRVLRLADGGEAADRALLDEAAFVVVAQVGANSFGIVVDRVFDTEEIVVKPVAPLLRSIPLFSGNTILGDGSVIMILDPNGVAATAAGQGGSEAAAQAEEIETHATESDDKVSLLIFRAGTSEPKAVPLSLIARLEEFEADKIEQANGRYVVQYRGKLMPLVSLDPSYPMRTDGRQPVLVFADETRAMGLAVDTIVDIVEEKLKVELKAERPGMLGSAIVRDLATEIVDVGYYLTQAYPDWFSRSDKTPGALPGPGRRVLLVDDSAFFRNMIAPLLQAAGYDVATADDAQRAIDIRDRGQMFDVIISDIEMPGMNGFELAEELKREGAWVNVPIIALSSRAAQEDFERGRQVGFADYVVKFDRDALMASLSETLQTAGGRAA